MSSSVTQDVSAGFLTRERFQALHDVLSSAGYRCLGPQVEDGNLVFSELSSMDPIPTGVIDHQQPGSYRLEETDSSRRFLWATSAQALKPLVFKPRETLWKGWKTDAGEEYSSITPETEKTAVIGVRSCDLAALAIQDKHFMDGAYSDLAYSTRRNSLFLVAVHCARSADTCFCASTGDGPAVTGECDLSLGETDDGFIISSHSVAGAQTMLKLNLEPVSEIHWKILGQDIESAASSQSRNLPSTDLRAVLYNTLDDDHWHKLASRCLSCGNCTSVCPTCFCFHTLDETTLDGTETHHLRQWDSCFSEKHGALSGLNIRSETQFRYRQWLLHKLGTWHEQQGRSGCVGCGRCISWCPVGIDLTREIRLLGENNA